MWQSHRRFFFHLCLHSATLARCNCKSSAQIWHPASTLWCFRELCECGIFIDSWKSKFEILHKILFSQHLTDNQQTSSSGTEVIKPGLAPNKANSELLRQRCNELLEVHNLSFICLCTATHIFVFVKRWFSKTPACPMLVCARWHLYF